MSRDTFFEELIEGGYMRRGREYAGSDHGGEPLKMLISKLLVEDGESWGDIERIIIMSSGRFAERLEASDRIKAEAAMWLEIEEPCDITQTLNAEQAEYVTNLEGTATLATRHPSALRFIVYTARRIFGNNVSQDGRPSVVSVPRHPEED